MLLTPTAGAASRFLRRDRIQQRSPATGGFVIEAIVVASGEERANLELIVVTRGDGQGMRPIRHALTWSRALVGEQWQHNYQAGGRRSLTAGRGKRGAVEVWRRWEEGGGGRGQGKEREQRATIGYRRAQACQGRGKGEADGLQWR